MIFKMDNEIKTLKKEWLALLKRAGIENNDSHQRDIVTVRWIFSKWAFDNGYTKTKIGKALNRHHSTILHAIKEYDKMVKLRDQYMMAMIHRIEKGDPKIKKYQIVTCPNCSGYVLFEETPVKNGLIYGQLNGRGYIIKYSTEQPMIKCNCES
jgi:hypothetical protein